METESVEEKVTKKLGTAQIESTKSEEKRTVELDLKKTNTVLEPSTQKRMDQMFDDIMSEYELKEEDRFLGKNSIFNSQIACLKYCHEVTKKLKDNELWNDPDFGPTSEDPYGEGALYTGERPPGFAEAEDTKWCRPFEIAPNKNPEFIDEAASSNDVIQGQIGNCWFIGALALLTSDVVYIKGDFKHSPEALGEISDQEADGMSKGLYCPVFHFLRKYGMFVIRFFKNYSWRYVVIDDKILCDSECPPVPVFGRCRNGNEFWVPLIEKAYAKIHNCYEALIQGSIDDGLTDMTGLVSEKTRLHGEKGFPSQEVGDKDEFWQRLIGFNKAGTMLGCRVSSSINMLRKIKNKKSGSMKEQKVIIDDSFVGLYTDHAYSIIDVFEIPDPSANNAHKSHRLIRIRNPWGKGEWNGAWSDSSNKLKMHLSKLKDFLAQRAKKQKECEQFDPQEDDGTFLMCYRDWRSIFTTLYASINFPPEWSGLRYTDKWTKENSGGVPDKAGAEAWTKNPQFIFELKADITKLFISLGQNDGRLELGQQWPFVKDTNCAMILLMSLDGSAKKVTRFKLSWLSLSNSHSFTKI